jgi:hypothetical protein
LYLLLLYYFLQESPLDKLSEKGLAAQEILQPLMEERAKSGVQGYLPG